MHGPSRVTSFLTTHTIKSNKNIFLKRMNGERNIKTKKKENGITGK